VLKRASRPAPRISPTTAVPMAMISSMLIPCDTGLSRDEVAIRTSTPVHPGIDSKPRIVEVAANVREEAKTPLGLRQAGEDRTRIAETPPAR